jgi:hypothetical protein
MNNPDTMLKPGQKVRIVINVDIAQDLDISDYLDETEETDISVRSLEMEIEDNFDIAELSYFAEVMVITAQITEIS